VEVSSNGFEKFHIVGIVGAPASCIRRGFQENPTAVVGTEGRFNLANNGLVTDVLGVTDSGIGVDVGEIGLSSSEVGCEVSIEAILAVHIQDKEIVATLVEALEV